MQNTLFTSAGTGDEKLRTDVIAIVQNEITVVDEHTPSPGEIQSDETIVLPEIISMTEYIRRHCEREIVVACINQIYMLRLCVMYEGKLFHDVPGLGPIDYGEEELVLTDGHTPSEWGEPRAHSYDPNIYVAGVRPVDGSITWMSFRRIADGCIEAELTIEMEINFRYGSYGRFKRITQKYYTTAWFDFDDDGRLHAEYQSDGRYLLRVPLAWETHSRHAKPLMYLQIIPFFNDYYPAHLRELMAGWMKAVSIRCFRFGEIARRCAQGCR